MFTKLLRNPFFALLMLVLVSPILGGGIVLFWLLTTVGSAVISLLMWPLRVITGTLYAVLGGGNR
jgi:hypothetical protein